MSPQSLYCPTCLRSVVPVHGACPSCGLSLASFALVRHDPTDVQRAQQPDTSLLLPPGYVADAAAIDKGAYRAVRSMTRLHVICARDKSVSMRFHDKACESNRAHHELIQSLAGEENRDGFFVSVIDFHHEAELVIRRMRAADALQQLTDLKTGGHGTNYVAALRLACAEAERQHDALEARPVVVVLGDGNHNGAGDPRVEARRLHSLVDVVVAVAFGSDADEDLLRNAIASDPKYFHRIEESGAELRRFFRDLGKTLSYTLQTGTPAEASLSTIQ